MDKGTPSNELYKKVCNRQKDLFEKETNKNYNEYMKYFFTDFSDLKEKVWEEAANQLKYSTTELSNEKHKDLKEKFDCIQNVLKNCGGLVEIVLRRIKCMLEYMPSDKSKTQHFFEHYINLHNKNVNYLMKIDSMFDGYEIEFNNESISTDLSAMKNSFEGFCYKFHCIRKKKL